MRHTGDTQPLAPVPPPFLRAVLRAASGCVIASRRLGSVRRRLPNRLDAEDLDGRLSQSAASAVSQAGILDVSDTPIAPGVDSYVVDNRRVRPTCAMTPIGSRIEM